MLAHAGRPRAHNAKCQKRLRLCKNSNRHSERERRVSLLELILIGNSLYIFLTRFGRIRVIALNRLHVSAC